MSFYDNIKRISKIKGLTLQEVAVKAGLSKNMIYQYRPGYGINKKGRHSDVKPSQKAMESIAEVLDVPVQLLIHDSLTEDFVSTGKIPATLPDSDSIYNNLTDEQIYSINEQVNSGYKIKKNDVAELNSPIFSLNGKKFSEEEAQEIRNYAKFVASQHRKNKK